MFSLKKNIFKKHNCDNCKADNFCEFMGTRVSQDLTCEQLQIMYKGERI